MRKLFGALLMDLGVFFFKISQVIDTVGDFFYENGESILQDTV